MKTITPLTPDSMCSTPHLAFQPVNVEINFEESDRNEEIKEISCVENSDSDTDYENPIKEDGNNKLKSQEFNSSSFDSSSKKSLSSCVLHNSVGKLWNRRNCLYFDSSPKTSLESHGTTE